MGIIEKIAPQWALKREVAKIRLQRLGETKKRSLEAVGGGRGRYDFLTESRSPDASFESDLTALRRNIRQLEQNNGFVSGPIKRFASNVVGSGFNLQCTVKPDKQYARQPAIRPEQAKRWNALVETAYKRWQSKADVRLINTFTEMLSLAEMALIRDNGVVIVSRTSRKRERLVPICLEDRKSVV